MKFWMGMIIGTLVLIWPWGAALAAGPIVLDGQFADWTGQPCVSDPQDGGTIGAFGDLKTFCFATNPGENTAYFMAERWPGAVWEIEYLLYVDIDGDGYVDRIVDVQYTPRRNNSRVRVDVYDGFGNFMQTIARNADWGESRTEGADLVEWGVPLSTLGISPGQTVDMVLATSQTYLPILLDTSSIVTWSPADALGVGILAAIVLSGVAWFTRLRRNMEG